MHRSIYANDSNRFRNKKSKPIPLRRISALSFQSTDTISHKNIPMTDKMRSYIWNPSTPRIDIATRTKTEATHLIYQSKVYLGVDDLNILLLFSISSFVNFVSLFDKLYTRREFSITFLNFFRTWRIENIFHYNCFRFHSAC